MEMEFMILTDTQFSFNHLASGKNVDPEHMNKMFTDNCPLAETTAL